MYANLYKYLNRDPNLRLFDLCPVGEHWSIGFLKGKLKLNDEYFKFFVYLI